MLNVNGWKTYACALIAAFAVFAKALGWIDEATYQVIIGLSGAGGLAALRAGVTKNGPIQ